MTTDVRVSTNLHRIAGALLVAGAAVFLLAEFIAAAAWTDPPYSYTYHYISNLGVHGPTEALGQDMYSPLAWVMNTGFALFGLSVFAGAVTLGGLHGWRRPAVVTLATLVGTGGVLLALNPGDGATTGGADYHALGAMAAIAGGNALVILLGRLHRPLGITTRRGRAMVALGGFGLVSLVGFLALAGSGANILIGLVERCAVYPVLLALISAGTAIRTHRP